MPRGGQGGGVSYYRERVTPQWIEISPMEGFVGVDESQQVLISVNSFGLEEGEYSTVLLLNSNDPETHSMSVPVDLVYVLGIEDKQFPNSYSLYPAYPNPFNPITNIGYDIPKKGHVSVLIYDMLGNRVRTLANGIQEASNASIIWNGRDDGGELVSAGVYIYQIQSGTFSQTKKMVLLK